MCPHSGFGAWAAALGHPWPSAANPASCRVAHGFKPAFGQRVFMGRLRSRSRSKASDQKIADFVSAKDVRARSKTKQGGLTADPILEASLDSNVGGGLLPIAVVQSQMHWLTHRYREQAPSHILTAIKRRNSGRVQARPQPALLLYTTQAGCQAAVLLI